MIRGALALGHTRLSIIDLETGWQPIANEDETIHVILNGEVYNFRQLRRDLEQSGHRFTTESDTETIVHLYEESGLRCVERMRGMFVFALWDEPNRRLVLARDRIGKKPLFYRSDADSFIFASELKALLTNRRVTPRVDPEALAKYLTYGYVPEPLSILDGVRKLPAAHVLTVDPAGVKLHRYWELPTEQDRKLTLEECASETRRLVDEATRLRLVSDVPLGFFLSGGLDSTAVVAAAAQSSTSALKTFSIGFEEETFSELKFARMAADHFGTDHEEFIVTADMAEDLEDLVWFADEPFADSSMVPTFYLSRLTRRHVTVALSGDGGDEAFGGYDRYLGIKYAEKYHRVPALLRRGVIGPLASLIPDGPGKRNSLRRVKRMLYPATGSPELWYRGWMQQFRSEVHEAAFTRDFFRASGGATGADDHLIDAFDRVQCVDRMSAAQWVDTMTYLPGDLMVKTDRMAMAHGLEVRSPLLDHKVLEYAARIPAGLRAEGRSTKRVLKQAYADVIPDEIIRRPKEGFTVPVASWIRGGLEQRVRDLLLDPAAAINAVVRPSYVRQMVDDHAKLRENHAIRIWNLLCLETWARKFKVALF